ncbi:MAG TPA: hypothetical protein PLI53_02480 [Geobacteraceae bacterium]|nr:hypothetical protein [Geobacteraceae bacterium]
MIASCGLCARLVRGHPVKELSRFLNVVQYRFQDERHAVQTKTTEFTSSVYHRGRFPHEGKLRRNAEKLILCRLDVHASIITYARTYPGASVGTNFFVGGFKYNFFTSSFNFQLSVHGATP